MKLIINKNQLGDSPEGFLRRAGYGFIRDSVRNKESYVRRLGNYHYPRLHMYVSSDSEKAVFDLHLDQKQTSYSGSHMHNAEYDGEVVEGEISRLRSLLSGVIMPEKTGVSPWEKFKQPPVEENFFTNRPQQEEDKGWWHKLFD